MIQPESPSIDALRRCIAQADSGFAPPVRHSFATGHDALDQALGGGLAHGRLHELFAGTVDDSASMTGFATMLALRSMPTPGPILWLRTDNAERACGTLYMPGLAELGGDPAQFVLALLPDDRMLLRAAGDAAACDGLGALVIECWGKAPLYDLTVSRRLTLAAEKSGVTLFLLRIDAQPVPSACETRWQVTAAPSTMLEPDAPGHVVLDIELLRRRAGPAGMRWQVEWNREERAFRKPSLPGALDAVVQRGAADPGERDTRSRA